MPCLRSNDPQAAFRIVLQLIPKHLAEVALDRLIAQHNFQIEEWDFSLLDSRIGPSIVAAYDESDGTGRVGVPQGQDPTERRHAVHRLITELWGQT